jgi:hypothetical protein
MNQETRDALILEIDQVSKQLMAAIAQYTDAAILELGRESDLEDREAALLAVGIEGPNAEVRKALLRQRTLSETEAYERAKRAKIAEQSHMDALRVRFSALTTIINSLPS